MLGNWYYKKNTSQYILFFLNLTVFLSTYSVKSKQLNHSAGNINEGEGGNVNIYHNERGNVAFNFW